MNNDDIIDALELTGKLMELHNENPFKSKAYANVSFRLSKLRYDFTGKTQQDIESIEGVGKGIAAKIVEFVTTGTSAELKKLLEITPAGVIDMLSIKGLGPKKVRQLWMDLQVESVGELLYACNENRLISLKGFGEKTQAQVKQAIEFKNANANKFHFASVEPLVKDLVSALAKAQPGTQISVVGPMGRKCEIIERVDILLDAEKTADLAELEKRIPVPLNYHRCSPEEFNYQQVVLSATPEHLEKISFASLPHKKFESTAQVYEHLQMQYIEPELREGLEEARLAKENRLPELIRLEDLRGILHNHSTYSDGVHSLKEMADYCRELGYSYFGICDHSKTAFYANGLSVERVAEQHREIDSLNQTYSDFRILKGIESDILGDGSLDYEQEVLKSFDFVVASVHANLKMSEEKATERLIKAIENPFTSILGHPTGRLLLARNGYPIDHKKVIDACAANKVSIELNAHPYRLDIDWRWIPYCLEKGVMISINPDAHHKEGFHDMYYGVCAARKGMLSKAFCLNALPLPELLLKFKK